MNSVIAMCYITLMIAFVATFVGSFIVMACGEFARYRMARQSEIESLRDRLSIYPDALQCGE